MNYLAHILLSGNDLLLLVGNFMGDGVKGSSLEHLQPQVRNGVRLHRAIDDYTDNHPLALQGRDRLRTQSGKYAGVVLDMFYDHLLSKNWEAFHDAPLENFIETKYRLLAENIELMPQSIQRMLPHMIAGDWLGSYARVDGLGAALNGIAQRASNGVLIAGSEKVLVEHYDEFSIEFKELFKDVQHMCEEMISGFEQ